MSLDTMSGVYVAQSLQGPAAQLALRLHASDEKRQSAFVEAIKKDATKQQEREHERQQKKQRLEQQQQLQRAQEQQQQQQQQRTQQQRAAQQQFQQQQLYMQQFQQQQYMHHMPWMPQLFTAAAVPVPVPAPAAVSVPYGRALSTLRHKYGAASKSYFVSRGFCVTNPPGAASVTAVFDELCVLRGSSALPEEATWFDILLLGLMTSTKSPSKTTSGSCISQTSTPLSDTQNASILLSTSTLANAACVCVDLKTQQKLCWHLNVYTGLGSNNERPVREQEYWPL
jgi:hypothetical protein